MQTLLFAMSVNSAVFHPHSPGHHLLGKKNKQKLSLEFYNYVKGVGERGVVSPNKKYAYLIIWLGTSYESS